MIEEYGVKEEYIKLQQASVKLALELNQCNEDKKQAKVDQAKQRRQIAHGNKELLRLHSKANEEKVHVYELLAESGFIKNVIDEFFITAYSTG